MARGINKVILIGNLGQKPEMRYTQTNTAVATLGLATSESWKDKESGEMRGRLSCELDSQRVALEELHNMKDSLTASNRQLDSDLCAASSKIQELHHLHKQKQQDKEHAQGQPHRNSGA